MRGVLARHPQEAALAAAAVALLGVVLALDPSFLAPAVQASLAAPAWELALVALPMTWIVFTAGIDLSVGAAMSLAGVVLGLCLERGLPVPSAAGLALASGAGAGLANGLLATRLRAHPLVVTLASMAVLYGVAEGSSQGRPVSGFPPELAAAFGGAVPGAAVLVAAVLAFFLSTRTVAGRAAQATGANEVAARHSGYSVDALKVWLYSAAGLAAGFAALFYAARRNTVTAEIGRGFELDVVTAVVVGGTVVTGGRGTVVGTLLGVLVVHEARQFVSWRWERDELNLIVVGALLVLTVAAHRFGAQRRSGAQ